MSKKAKEALQNSNSLLAAMLHEARPEQEIEAQIIENNLALAALPPLRARDEIARAALAQCVEWRDKKWSPKTISILGLESPSDAHIDEARKFTEETWARARAVLALSLPAGQEWRDISSAPQDGRDLWLWKPDWPKALVGGWVKKSVTNNGRAVWMLYGGHVVEPTHWQPYHGPAPPVAEPIVAEKSQS